MAQAKSIIGIYLDLRVYSFVVVVVLFLHHHQHLLSLLDDTVFLYDILAQYHPYNEHNETNNQHWSVESGEISRDV